MDNIFGPVVQLNRTSDSGSEGRGFESRRDHKYGRGVKFCVSTASPAIIAPPPPIPPLLRNGDLIDLDIIHKIHRFSNL